MSKKSPWIFSLSLALLLAPALHSADEAPAKADEKQESGAAEKAAEPEKPAAKSESAAEAKTEEKAAASGGRKSKAIAAGLAVFPGIAVHGSGHMYGGSWMKGLGLLAIEAASVGIVVANVNGLQADIDKVNKSNGVPTDISGFYTKVGILSVCSMAFLWSWFDDMAGAPIAVAEYNKLKEQESSAQLRLAPRGDGAQVALSADF